MKHRIGAIVLTIAAVTVGSAAQGNSAAAKRAGGACTRSEVGKTARASGGATLVCRASGKRYVWTRAATPTTSAPRPQVTAAVPTTVAPATTAAKREPIKVKFVASSPGVASLDLWVARWGGYFEDEGLDISFGPETNNGALAANVVLTDADLSSTAFSSVLAAVDQGRKIRMFAASAHGGSTGVVTISKEIADRLKAAGITSQSPIRARLEAMKGLRIGVSGAIGQLLRAAFIEYGMDPNRDVTLQNMDLSAMPATLRAGRIDAFIITPPHSVQPEADGFGVTWICGPCGDVPTWNKGIYIVYVTSESFAQKNPEVLKRFTAAVERAHKLIQQNPFAVVPIIKQQYPDLPEAIRTKSVLYVADAFRGTNVTTREILDAIELANASAERKANVKPEALWITDTLRG